jgi:hypothetical protein
LIGDGGARIVGIAVATSVCPCCTGRLSTTETLSDRLELSSTFDVAALVAETVTPLSLVAVALTSIVAFSSPSCTT